MARELVSAALREKLMEIDQSLDQGGRASHASPSKAVETWRYGQNGFSQRPENHESTTIAPESFGFNKNLSEGSEVVRLIDLLNT